MMWRYLRHPLPNTNFIERIFGPTEYAVWLVAFEGDPSTVGPVQWAGSPYFHGEEHYDEILRPWDFNTFACISTFKDGERGYRRRQDQFAECHCLILDDVGTKTPADKITLPPTWVNETSEGNFQIGYAFAQRVTSADLVCRLQQAFVRAGLSQGDELGVTRLFRLPQGLNQKAAYNPPWRHSFRVFDNSARYTPLELIEHYELELEPARKPFAPVSAENDPYLALLEELGLVLRDNGNHWFDILCPWREHHSDRGDTGAAYKAGGAFRCHHGHCQDKDLNALRRWLRTHHQAPIARLDLQLAKARNKQNDRPIVTTAGDSGGPV